MELVPISFREANAYVERFHRHHGRVQGYKFAVGCAIEGQLKGIAIAGRPVSRHLDDGRTLEVTRLCTDGTANACSFLYSAVRRAAKELGYKKVVTYILETENGSSLAASNWKDEGPAGGGSWNSATRHRVDKAPTAIKRRWAVSL